MSTCPIQLIAGLGNPGKSYATSRHNAGAWFVQAFAKSESLCLKTEARFHGTVAQWSFTEGTARRTCWLLIPTTYMNHSGRALGALARFYHISPEAILLVHDDLDLPVGTIRFKYAGGEGGHNGLKDSVAQLGSKNFWRLRIGIGHPGQRDQVHDYVLSAPSLADRQKIDQAIAFAISLLNLFIRGNQQKAIQQLHQCKEK